MKSVQISILARVSGNVNADEVIGNRITIKKMYDSDGNVYPFVSARAIKYAIRMALKDKGFKIDPLGQSGEQWVDSGKPWEYVDNDLFGYMVPKGGETAKRRTAPIAISYFKALRNTNINTDFGGRFPRQEGNPNIFEVEVADIIGRLNVLMYDYIGRPSSFDNEKWEMQITEEERKRRIRAFLEILLIERFVLPRRTNSLNVPEYYYALVSLSKNPLPIYQYLDYTVLEDGIPKLDTNKIKELVDLIENLNEKPKLYLIDYTGKLDNIDINTINLIKGTKIKELIDEITNWL